MQNVHDKDVVKIQLDDTKVIYTMSGMGQKVINNIFVLSYTIC